MVTKDNKPQLLEFSKYFKSLYEARRLNKAELSRLSGVSDATLSRLESGTQQPSPETLRRLAPVLMVSKKELMIKAGHMPDTDDEDNSQIDEPEIRAIQRAAKNMTPQQKKKMLGMMKLAFEEAFSEDD